VPLDHTDYAGAYYTVDEVATALRLHPTTVLRWVQDGRLKADRIGKGYRIRPADLEAFVEAGRNLGRALRTS